MDNMVVDLVNRARKGSQAAMAKTRPGLDEILGTGGWARSGGGFGPVSPNAAPGAPRDNYQATMANPDQGDEMARKVWMALSEASPDNAAMWASMPGNGSAEQKFVASWRMMADKDRMSQYGDMMQ